MPRFAAAVMLFLVAGSSVFAQTPSQAQTNEPVVVTTGEGTVRRAPDRAWVTISAESRAKGPREAQKMNAQAMDAVLQRLKTAALPSDAIRTLSYDLQPEYDYVSGRQVLRGYVARNSIEVRVDDLPKLGEILDLAVTAGATNVGGVRFDLKDRAAIEREALKLAVADARARADAAASGAGMRVERVLRIEEHRGGGPVPPPRPVMTMRAEMQVDTGQPPVAPGELEIRSDVTLTVVVR